MKKQKTQQPLVLSVALLLLSIMLVVACASDTPVSEATVTPDIDSEATATEAPTSVPTPTRTPAPTATPMPLPPPRLLSHSPAPGEELALDAPIELTFDQPMDHSSVEDAWTISPAVEGAFTWLDARTLRFTPRTEPSETVEGGLQRGVHYRVNVADTAMNAEGEPVTEPISFEFNTVGYLFVSQVMPAPTSVDLDPNTTVTVVFNRPVVPLTTISSQAELPQPLTFIPPVRGDGEWLNTSIYQFRPEEGFLPATHYKGRVAAGLKDTTGAVLEEDYTWEFGTLQPAILEVSPRDGFDYVGPTEVISVTFNQPMDHSSVQARFTLEADNQPVDGTIRWSGGETPTSPETMVFAPARELARDTLFAAKVGEGVQARAGGDGTLKAKSWKFSTVSEPGLIRTVPANGEKDVAPSGSVRLVFASPMQREGFMDHLSISPKVTTVYTYWSTYDTEVRLYFEREPATSYTLSLGAQTPDKYGAELGETVTLRFTTGDLSPHVSLSTMGRLSTFGTYTETVIYAAYRNVSRLDVTLYQLNPTRFISLNTDWSAWDNYRPSEGDLVRRWSKSLTAPRNETRITGLHLTSATRDPLPPGLYYIEITAPEVEKPPDYQPSRSMFVKSGVNLTLKQTRSEVLIWATDLQTGESLPGLPISLYDRSKLMDAGGKTGEDGLLLIEELDIENSLWDPFFAIAGEPGEESFALAYNGWDEGISPWSFDVDSEFWSSEYLGYLYTDRPIYRPGQSVYFKGILRADDDARYRLPGEEDLPQGPLETLQVRVSDPRGKELFDEELKLSDMGTFFDELRLDEQASLGTYFIEMLDPEGERYLGSTSFQLAEYKAPEFQVTVTPDRDAYLDGDTIGVSASGTYYFGGPVTDADVRWSVLSSDYTFRYYCPQGRSCPRYSWADYEWGGYDDESTYGSYGRPVAEGTAQTDDEGRVTFKVSADIASEDQSQVFTIEASLTDVNGQEVSNRTAAIVHKGEFYVGVAPRGYLAQVGEEVLADLLTVDWNGETVADVALTVTFMEHRWYSVRRQEEDGNFYWDWASEDIPVFTSTVRTGDDGQAIVTYVPKKAGSYKVRAVATDTQKNEIQSAAYFWVWGGDGFVSWRQESNNRIDLIADKEEYQVGDVAEILVASPYSGTVQALVTIERGHIMEAKVQPMEGNSEVLRVPITQDMVPNAFLSAVIVQGAEQAPGGLASFKMGVIRLPVSVAPRELTITLTPDRDMEAGEHYGPRQDVTYDLLVTDYQGQPVEAELSLRLADVAVLALADEPGPTLLETFWRSRGLGVRTSTPLVVAMEPFNREVSPGAKGGGGGEGGLVRSQFADTAFWDPVVRTGADGTAQVSVTLPDNLTTWRMQARGITADTKVGRAEVDVLSTLDLLVRPVLPRFFVAGDEAEIATIVHNNTASELEAKVGISVNGLALKGEASQTLSIPAGDRAKVVWPVEALPGSEVTVRMWANADDPAGSGEGLYDGREDVLPVYHYSTPEVVATAGRLGEAGVRQEVVQLPRVLDPTQGELTVQLDGSLTAAAQDALDYLEHYPYECVEQTVSRFLPNVVTWQALEEMGIERPELQQKLSQMVGIGLQRLYAQQHYDGGWGWWVSDESDPYLTAYVLQGMIEARRAGFVVDEEVVTKATGYLRDRLSVAGVDTDWEANRLAYQLYVLAEYGHVFDKTSRGELGLAVRLFDKRHLLGRYGQATLAVALDLLEEEGSSRAQTLLSDLAGDAVASATGFHWEENQPDYWNMNTDIRTTAIVLWAMSRLETDPSTSEGSLLPGTVRWLMTMRKEGYWETTQGTAWSLLGLVAYMRASGELAGDFSYTVYLNGEEWAAGDVSEENIDESRRIQVEIARLLLEEGNRLVIERHAARDGQSGEGQLYYSAALRTYLPADQVKALDRGVIIARQYSPVDSPDRVTDSARVGDVIRVKLTIIAPTDLHYVVVEDPLPAGFEGVDLSLKTTSVVGERPELRNLSAEEENRWFRQYGWGWWWFSHSEMRDEKVTLFAQYLPRGTYEYTYLMRAGVPGEFLVIPATAYEMYFPEVFGRSDGGLFTVQPAD